MRGISLRRVAAAVKLRRQLKLILKTKEHEMESNDRLFAVVTGASSGIGYELARLFAKNGYDLLVTSGIRRRRRSRV
jgi:hypothetical protein